MSIVLKTLVIDGIGTECKIIQIDTAEDYKHFQKMVNQGTNLWPDAPAVIKSFADMVTSGKVHQPYSDDPVPKVKGECKHEWFKPTPDPGTTKLLLRCKRCPHTEVVDAKYFTFPS